MQPGQGFKATPTFYNYSDEKSNVTNTKYNVGKFQRRWFMNSESNIKVMMKFNNTTAITTTNKYSCFIYNLTPKVCFVIVSLSINILYFLNDLTLHLMWINIYYKSKNGTV